MENSSKYFKNVNCSYFPCHSGMRGEAFNCLFCYCPMNPYEDCLGSPSTLSWEKGLPSRIAAAARFPMNQNIMTKSSNF